MSRWGIAISLAALLAANPSGLPSAEEPVVDDPPASPASADDAASEETPVEDRRRPAGHVLVLTIQGPIGLATSDYFISGIREATETGARAVVLKLDTPGGLDGPMRDMIKAILGSRVPVITYVSPSGGRAASAGTYILYASHVAAMAPATNLGAATPVQMGGGGDDGPGGLPRPGAPEGTEDEAGEDEEDGSGDASDDAEANDRAEDEEGPAPGNAMERKVINDAVAYIRGLAELRGRNADWAERAVREAVSLPAEDAAEQDVVDLVAGDLTELLEAVDGTSVDLAGREHQLATAGAEQRSLEPDWRTELLAVITDPSVAYLLLLIGIYGLIFEGYNPGALVPGIVGVICLLLAAFALQVLPVNYAGLGLMFLGIALMIAEAFAPSFGALGIGGVVAFTFGAVILFDSDVPGFGISPWVLGTTSALAGLAVLGTIYLAVSSHKRPVHSGVEEMLHETVDVPEAFEGRGVVRYRGEIWTARADGRVPAGRAKIKQLEGLTLVVEPAEEERQS